jgi:hypothetical protein
MLAFIVFVAAALGLFLWGTEGTAGDEFIMGVVIVGILVALFPIVFLWQLFRQPAVMYQELKTHVDELRTKLNPSFRLVFSPYDGFALREFGTHTIFRNGKMQSVQTGEQQNICVRCENISSKPIDRCEAQLIEVLRIGDDGNPEQTLWKSSARLAWTSPDEDAHMVRLAPQSVEYVVILFRVGDGFPVPNMENPNSPFQYRRIFEPSGSYRVTIAVSGDDAVTEILPLEFTWNAQTKDLIVIPIASR